MGKERKKFLSVLPANGLNYEPLETITISGNRKIGINHPVFIIAEIGANHKGDINIALKLIEKAATMGVDAVKFQHLKHKTIASDAPVDTEWNGKKDFNTLAEFYKPSEMPYEWTERLINHAKKHNILFLSTPFDKEAVDILEKFHVPAYKISSYEMTDDMFLTYVAKKGKPIILSTGMASLEEVAHAVAIIQEAGNSNIALLHCVSIYPPKSFKDLNLRAIETLAHAFKLPVGYSDHSTPPYVAPAITAVTLGACIIERHFTNTQDGGSRDDANSMEFSHFEKMVQEIRNAEEALSGNGIKQPVVYSGFDCDEIFDRWARRSIHAVCDISKDTILTEDMLTTLRPWGGVEPKDYKKLIGKKVIKNIKIRNPIKWEDVV